MLHVDPIIGNDTNSGATGSPFRTLQKALSVAVPGTTIRLASGVYQETNQTVTAGTAAAPIVIEPEPGAKPILDGKGNTLNALHIVKSYYVIRNLEIRNTSEGVRLEGVTGVTLENNIIYNVNNEGVRIHLFSVGNTLRGNKIWGCGLTSNGEGIYIGTAPEQRNNNGGLPDTSTHNIISGNEIYDVDEGIDIKEDASFNIIENNLVYNTFQATTGGINVRSDQNIFYGNVSRNNAGAGFRFGGDIAFSPIYGNNYHYAVKNVLRNNVANDNAGYGYKFMNGPQDADTTNTGGGNGGLLYHYASGVSPFVAP